MTPSEDYATRTCRVLVVETQVKPQAEPQMARCLRLEATLGLLHDLRFDLTFCSMEEAGQLMAAGSSAPKPAFEICLLRMANTQTASDGESGLETVLLWLRALKLNADAIPVLVLGASGLDSDEEVTAERRLREAGAGDYVPFSQMSEPILARAIRYGCELRRREVEWRDRQASHSVLLQSTSLVIVAVDEDSVIHNINDAARAVFGYAPHELIGRSLTLLMSEESAHAHETGMQRYVQSGRKRLNWDALELQARHRDGRVVPLEVTFGEYTLDGKRFFSGVMRDISERHLAQVALRASEERYARVADNVPGMVYQFVLRSDGRAYFSYLSEGAGEIYGIPVDELRQDYKWVERLVHPEDREALVRAQEHSRRTLEEWVWTGRIVMSSGEVKWVEGRSRPAPQDNGDIVWDGVLQDVSLQKRTEAELRRVQIELENRVARRTEQLARANAELQSEIGERLRAEAVLRLRARQQEALALLSQRALMGVDFDALMRGVVSLVASTLEVEFSVICRADPARNGHVIAYDVGLGDVGRDVVFASDSERSVLHQVMTTNSPQVISNWNVQTHFDMPDELRERGVASSLYAFVAGDGEPFGVLSAHSKRSRHFSMGDVQFMQAMANVVASTLESRRLTIALRNSRELLQTVLDNASVMIYIKDLQGHYILTNRRVEEFMARFFPAQPPLLHHTDADIFPTSHAQRMHDSDLHIIQTRQNHTVEETVQDSTSSTIAHFLTTKFPLFDSMGQLTGIGGISADITERKNEEFARDLAHREAERARAEADRANHAKSEFLSRMSHELRTPLNAILGFAQLLEMTPLPESSQQGVGQILKAGYHLLSLINEVLNIARIEAGSEQISLEAVSTHSVLAEVMDFVAPVALGRGISIQWEGNRHEQIYVLADRQRLLQILLNLVGNALKYNFEGGSVFCSVSLHSNPSISANEAESVEAETAKSETVRIGVRDTGPGIAPEKISRLWTPFDRLDAEKRGIEGTGLGLALSRSLAQSMNGRLDVQSPAPNLNFPAAIALAAGCVFWLELPVARAMAPGEENTIAQVMAQNAIDTPRRGTVLLIEDNPSNVMLVERMFDLRPDLDLSVARDGRSGLRMAREKVPDIVLLDLHLPDLHGSQVLGELRADVRTQMIQVVIVSADATREQIELLRDAGARAYVTKPLKVSQLLETLDDILRGEP